MMCADCPRLTPAVVVGRRAQCCLDRPQLQQPKPFVPPPAPKISGSLMAMIAAAAAVHSDKERKS